MIEITGTVNGRTRFKIQEYFYNGWPAGSRYRIFIGGIYRTTTKTLKGAKGTVTEIGPMVIEKESERLGKP